MKIFLIGNQARAISNFWSVLIRRMREQGHEVVCLVPAPQQGPPPQADDHLVWEERLRALGVRLVHYPLDRKGLNPLRDIATVRSLRKLFLRERPDVLFASTIKPVIYGSFASFLTGIPRKNNRYLMITGLGYMFEGGSLKKNILLQLARLLYRSAFMCAHMVFFQNRDDLKLFQRLRILPSAVHVRMCRGTGVDLEKFAPAPLPSGPVRFLFIGRLLEAKGLREFFLAAEQAKKQIPDADFAVLGPEEHGPGAVPATEAALWQERGIIRYLGATSDVRPYIAEAHVVVLPSWREGLPCSLMEAMGMGRALVAADAPGSRDVVRREDNGLLVPVRNPDALAAAFVRLANDPALVRRMGQRGREIAEQELSADMVAQGILRDMRLLSCAEEA